MLRIIFHLLSVFCLLKYYAMVRKRRAKTHKCMVGKTAIITGANSGIGYQTALEFAKRGARVILACRNEDRGEKAKNKIIQNTGNENVVLRLVDLSSFESVKVFAKEINATEDRLDILVNNAGMTGVGRKQTKDNMSMILQVNYLSGVLLTNLLLDLLKKSAPSRVVNVSSVAASLGRINRANLNAFPKYSHKGLSDFLMYSNSKLCSILYTRVLAKQLSETGVTINALHPGVIATNIFRPLPPLLRCLTLKFISVFFMSAEQGAQTTVHVALSEEVDGVNGKLFSNCKIVPFYRTAANYKFAENVFAATETLLQEALCENKVD